MTGSAPPDDRLRVLRRREGGLCFRQSVLQIAPNMTALTLTLPSGAAVSGNGLLNTVLDDEAATQFGVNDNGSYTGSYQPNNTARSTSRYCSSVLS